ncbi:MAG: STAS/SEC14 domain-containing protein [Cyclobacteriaceae bacterium]
MIELIESKENLVAFRMDSTASEADLRPLLACMNNKLQVYKSLNLLIEYVDTGGFSMDTLVEDFSYRLGNWTAFSKVAIITFNEWLAQADQLSHQLEETCLRSFPYAHQAEAKHWIEQQENQQLQGKELLSSSQRE